ncbi:MAG: HlyD family secretion protein, partial [Rhodospirillales bacterium]|nr:HlyD family secretion protein [Rhodospirillales bacterium]
AEARALAAAAATELDRVRIAAPARLAAARAALAAAQADAAKADRQWRRQLGLPRGATTEQAIDAAVAAHRAADAAVTRAAAELRAADTVADRIAAAAALREERDAEVALAQARLATAALDLRWTVLRAPRAGWITKRAVELGNQVRPGQALLSLVGRRVWVTANLKETALARLLPGDRVRIDIDAYPGMVLRGHVASFQHGTGARFSAFPAENATGNYVKVVQRVPVRIDIDSGLDPARPLPLGLSVEPVIRLQ